MSALRSTRRGGSLADQRQRAEATRDALVAAGRSLFTARGYQASSNEDIVAEAHMTRGALYHHFSDKQALFAAVFSQVLEELILDARAAVSDQRGDRWAQLIGSLRAYLGLVANRPDAQRIILIDGPAVLGWGRWRELQAEWIDEGIAVTMTMLADDGHLSVDAEPLAILIQGALNEAALAIAHAIDPSAASAKLISALDALLEGLRTSMGKRV